MSTGRRAYDLLRGYVGREYDRLQGLERISAEDELSQAMNDASLRGSKKPPTPEPKPSASPIDAKTHAARILGVSAGASFEEVRKSFERLNKRSEPSNFPPGSPERQQAGEIQRRVQWAYQTLTDGVDATERRFRSLEID